MTTRNTLVLAEVLVDGAEARDEPPPHAHAEYADKYREGIRRVSASPEAFSEEYPVPLRVRPDRVRGF